MNLHAGLRKHNDNRILEVRSLTTADLAQLRLSPGPFEPIKRIRERHHHIAWLIALGRSNTEIATEMRMSPQRVSQHRADPSMRDLVAKRVAELDASRAAIGATFQELATRNMLRAERLLDREQARLESDPKAPVDMRGLNNISATRMDRFGFPKHSTTDSRNININFGASLEAAIARSRKA